MNKLDWTASSVIMITLLLLSGVIYMGNQIPIDVICQPSLVCTQVSPFGSILFEFSRPVQSDQVEKLWQTNPPIAGKWEWLDDQHVRWSSIKPLPSDQKTILQFVPGQAGQNGEPIRTTGQWEVSVRAPQIVTSRKVGNGPELFSIGLEDGASEKQLTHSDGHVYDYQVSPDGETVVFSVMNDRGGIDLWVVQRDGTNQHKLLDCGADRCSTPAWSPIFPELAYTREGAGLTPNGSQGAPRIWIFDVKSGQTVALFTDAQKIGYGPKWSSDGQWLSIWNGVQGGIQVVNRKTGVTFLLESTNGDAGCWSPDSQYLYYSTVVVGTAGYRNIVLRADIASESFSTVLSGNFENEGFSVYNPVCSPKDKLVAVTIQPYGQTPGAELFLLNPDAKDGISIMNDLTNIPSFYSWTLDGNRVVYQLDSLDGTENAVEIWIWDRKTGASKKISSGSSSPQWLP